MDISQKILSDITVFNKYAKYIPEAKRRENWQDLSERNMVMHIRKYPHLKDEIKAVYRDFVFTKKVLPSMRSMQFGGQPIELSNNRMFNCAYVAIDNIAAFWESMFLLLGGSGVGFSVQKQHVAKLPEVKGTLNKNRRFLVGDSIEGWSDAVKVLMRAHFEGKSDPVFDFRDIRAKGAKLITSGGKAPGPEPLRLCLDHLRAVLNNAKGRNLTTLECHDMMCHIADAVLSGGIRRAALISLFSIDDWDMLSCKTGAWWELNPQRGRSNNSVVLERGSVTEEQFKAVWGIVKASGSGEPGFFWTNDTDMGTNPCCFTANMRLLTDNGYVSFGELSKLDSFNIVNPNGNVTVSKVWSSGEKDIVSLKLSNGTIVECTPDHVFLSGGKEVQASEMKGLRVTPNFNVKVKPNNVTDFKAGFIFGDGQLSRLLSDSHKGLEVYIGEKDNDLVEYFGVPSNKKVYSTEAREIALAYNLPSVETFDRYLPTNGVSDDFMMGVFSANGSVIKSGKRVALKTSSPRLAKDVKEWLLSKGMTPYVTTNKSKVVKFSNGEYKCKESYDVNISGIENLTKFAKTVSFIHKYKQDALTQAILNSAPVVLSVKPSGVAEVFDFTEPETHWGIVEDCVVHNCEISLRSMQFCNLTTTNVSDVESQQDLEDRVKAAAFLGTLQAGYTDFHYLRQEWKDNTEKDALIGAGMTGIGSGKVLEFDLVKAAEVVNKENARVAALIGINPAARTTTIKPEGTSSLTLGCSSGIHAWHNDYYIRRMRVGKNEALYSYMLGNFPSLVEDCKFKPHLEAVMSFPQQSPEGSILRHEPALELLERVKKFNKEWVFSGYRSGSNQHNVSCTISIREQEWDEVGNWMWDNRELYTGISVLPYDTGTYVQAPFEDCTKEHYEEMSKLLHDINLDDVIEDEDNTSLNDQSACAGGACEIK